MATIDRRALLVIACVISHIQTTPVHLPKDKKMHGRRERRRRIKYASRSMKIDAALPPISSRTQRKRCQRCPFTPPIRIGGVRLNYTQRNTSVDLKVNWPTKIAQQQMGPTPMLWLARNEWPLSPFHPFKRLPFPYHLLYIFQRCA